MTDEKSIAHFACICRELEESDGSYSPREAIGTYMEKQMHVALKRYATTDESRYEVKIGPYIADVCEKDRITEIQTGGFYPLREKIAYYLNETEYHVTILHPSSPSGRGFGSIPQRARCSPVTSLPAPSVCRMLCGSCSGSPSI